jgi:hypothetical protein
MQLVRTNKKGLYLVVTALVLVLCGELYIDLILTKQLPNYNSAIQTLSYIGAEGSPLAEVIKWWGVCHTLLFAVFAYGFYSAFEQKNAVVKMAVVILVIYGLGEGVGSGFFPVDAQHSGTVSTSFFLHNLFGGFADLVVFGLPTLVLRLFPKKYYERFHIQTWVCVGSVLLFSGLFMASKYFNLTSAIFEYRGLWQRCYMISFYIYFVFLSVRLYRSNHE